MTDKLEICANKVHKNYEMLDYICNIFNNGYINNRSVLYFMKSLKDDVDTIIENCINDVMPNKAVERALLDKEFPNDVIIISIGKAAWTMAHTANTILNNVKLGIVITKYQHSKGAIGDFDIFQAGHPILDNNSILATEKVIQATCNLDKNDTVIFLISGGGSALFEKLRDGVSLDDMKYISHELLNSGADIEEINTVRKHLSEVKGGGFAKICEPAKVFSIILSDVIDDKVSVIASGPSTIDTSTSQDALNILEKYKIQIKQDIHNAILIETPKELLNSEYVITGSVTELCKSAYNHCLNLGYTPIILTTSLDCEAREAGKFLGSIIKNIVNTNFSIKTPCAIITGGETVVKVAGEGMGGRNQELALALSKYIEGMDNVAFFSIGSDGTDGPTDAAGGVVYGDTFTKLKEQGINIDKSLTHNDSYNALTKCNGLIFTGATGTNVNDLQVALIR